jgi:diguanylate cyclase (GGDEF)-like protein
MGTTDAMMEHDGALPARAVISVPSLRVLEIERNGATESFEGDTTILDLFTDAIADVIRIDIVPEMLANTVWSGELDCQTKTGSTTAVTLWVPHHDQSGTPQTATVLIGAAITEYASRVAPDPLTSLPTRVVLLDRLDQARRRSRRNGDLMAALFIDLDGLKSVNDRHGHDQGDAALIRAADRIRSSMRDGDTVARFGGDEFVVLCESLDHEGQANRVAERILETLAEDGDLPLSASIGLAFDRGGALSALDLVGRADAAMYRAKAHGGDRVEVFDTAMAGRIAADATLRTKLLHAIRGDRLDVAAQPIYALSSGTVVGVELFIRLHEEGESLVSGTDVLRLVREHAESIDAAMFGRAIAVARSWRRELRGRAPRVHVNVSGQSLASPDFSGRVESAFRRHNISGRHFAFEVDATEFGAIGSREIATLSTLKELGVSIVMDGYGDGGTSLHVINRLRPSLVKVAARSQSRDQAFSPNVIIGLVRSAATLGVGTCVKGVESRALLDRVVDAGTFAAQGNLLTPVGSLTEIRPLLGAQARLGF